MVSQNTVVSSLCKGEAALEKVIKSLDSWKKLIVDVYEQDETERKKEMNVLKSYVEAYAQLEKHYEKTNCALKSLDEKLESEVKCEDVDSLYQECFDNLPAGSTNNYQDSRVWQLVFSGISDVMEVHKKKKKIKDSEFEQLGDSLLCSNVFSPPLDPISKVVIKNAYKNRKCGHVYEFNTISDYIKNTKSKAKCPYIGCNNNILKMTDLVQDGGLQTQITRYLETQNSEDSEEEDDE